MITNFGDKTTQDLFNGIDSKESRKFPVNLHSVAQRKLYYLEAAGSLDDLRRPPANMLKKLKGDLDGFYSIRINEQWRIIFRWIENSAENVRVVDYH